MPGKLFKFYHMTNFSPTGWPRLLPHGLALLLGLLGTAPAAQAQLTISSTSPVANAKAAPAAGPVAVTFNQVVTSGLYRPI